MITMQGPSSMIPMQDPSSMIPMQDPSSMISMQDPTSIIPVQDPSSMGLMQDPSSIGLMQDPSSMIPYVGSRFHDPYAGSRFHGPYAGSRVHESYAKNWGPGTHLEVALEALGPIWGRVGPGGRRPTLWSGCKAPRNLGHTSKSRPMAVDRAFVYIVGRRCFVWLWAPRPSRQPAEAGPNKKHNSATKINHFEPKY